MTKTQATSKYFITSDNVKLHYLELGVGKTLVMIPGWSQTAEEFKYQINELSQYFHCVAIDMRGHGESENVNYGYRISRFAKDVYEFLESSGLSNIILLGHSLGAAVIWSYLDLFGSDRIAKIITIDEPAFLMVNPNWTNEEVANYGAVFTSESLDGIYQTLANRDGIAFTEIMLGKMLTPKVKDCTKAWMLEENLKLSREHAATLIYNNSMQDWRDVISRITIPTLVIGGRVSATPWRSQEWIHHQIQGSKLEIFEEEEGGQHFMFIENPGKFNSIIKDFLEG